MWYYSPTKKNKLIYQVRANTIPPLGPFSLKNDALPLNSLLWSPPTAVHIFDAWDIVVPGLYISWYEGNILKECLINSFLKVYFTPFKKEENKKQGWRKKKEERKRGENFIIVLKHVGL